MRKEKTGKVHSVEDKWTTAGQVKREAGKGPGGRTGRTGSAVHKGRSGGVARKDRAGSKRQRTVRDGGSMHSGRAGGSVRSGRTGEEDGSGYVSVNPRKLNPNAFWLMRFMNDRQVRFIFLRGGSSSSKSFSVAQMVLCQTLYDEENTLVMRKVGASILKTIYEDYRVAARGLGLYGMFQFKMNCIQCVANGARIDFSGLDDPEKIKGIANYKRLHLEELTEFDLADFKQLRKRLRGREGQQIIATFNPISEHHWIKEEFMDNNQWHDIPMKVTVGGERIPDELTRVKSVKMNAPKQVANIRTGEIEEHAPDAVVIQSTYLNNFWVVGSPDGTYGYYDEQCIADFEYDRLHDPAYYMVYALGEWGVIKTGSEFFGSFTPGRDTAAIGYVKGLPVHLSVDNNVLPYISVSLWQLSYGLDGQTKQLRQFHEICAKQPDNSVRRAAALTADYLDTLGVTGEKVYLHGDASTKMRNTIDEARRSWLDLFIDGLVQRGYEVVDRVGARNPSVALTGEFVNAIFESQIEGVSLKIGEDCRTSVEDYQAVQKDENGGMLKTKIKDKVTGQTYEAHGHLSDTMRYIVYDVCYDEFTRFSQRRKRNLYDTGLLYYNPAVGCVYDYTLLYLLPDISGLLLLVEARRVAVSSGVGSAVGDSGLDPASGAGAGASGALWDVTKIITGEAGDTAAAEVYVLVHSFDVCIVECAPAYYGFVRDLRVKKGNNEEIRVLPESGQPDKRIAATAEFVKGHIRFCPESDQDGDYSRFMDNLLDYNRAAASGVREAAVAVSGIAIMAMKL